MFHLLSVEPTIHYYIERSFIFEWKQKNFWKQEKYYCLLIFVSL